jgi:hypothetical protein
MIVPREASGSSRSARITLDRSPSQIRIAWSRKRRQLDAASGLPQRAGIPSLTQNPAFSFNKTNIVVGQHRVISPEWYFLRSLGFPTNNRSDPSASPVASLASYVCLHDSLRVFSVRSVCTGRGLSKLSKTLCDPDKSGEDCVESFYSLR